jgi:LmeA-like phospholipid-binding
MRKRKWKWIAALVAVLAVLLFADQAARVWAEGKLRDRAAAYYPPSTSASASIRSFPFLGRLLANGTVPEVTLSMQDIRYGVVVVSSLTVDLHSVLVDRDQLFKGHVRLLDVGQGRIEARLDATSLGRAAGVDLRIADGLIQVHKRVQGVDVNATARVTFAGNVVRVEPIKVQGAAVPASALAGSYKIPGAELLPCPPAVRTVPGAVILSCAVDDVPAVLVQQASR